MKVFDTQKNRFYLRTDEKKRVIHAWNFGPPPVNDDELACKFPNYGTQHPRIMVGYFEPGRY